MVSFDWYALLRSNNLVKGVSPRYQNYWNFVTYQYFAGMVSFDRCRELILLYKSVWGIKTTEILLRINNLNTNLTPFFPFLNYLLALRFSWSCLNFQMIPQELIDFFFCGCPFYSCSFLQIFFTSFPLRITVSSTSISSARGIKTAEILLRINILNRRRICLHPKFMRTKICCYCIAILLSFVLYIESWHKKYGWFTVRVYRFTNVSAHMISFWLKRSNNFVVQVSIRYQNYWNFVTYQYFE